MNKPDYVQGKCVICNQEDRLHAAKDVPYIFNDVICLFQNHVDNTELGELVLCSKCAHTIEITADYYRSVLQKITGENSLLTETDVTETKLFKYAATVKIKSSDEQSTDGEDTEVANINSSGTLLVPDHEDKLSDTTTTEQWGADTKSAQPEELYVCSVCHRGFSKKTAVAKHEERHKRDKKKTDALLRFNPSKTYRCIHCPQVYKSKKEYTLHAKTHIKVLLCDLCGKNFTSQFDLDWHFIECQAIKQAINNEEMPRTRSKSRLSNAMSDRMSVAESSQSRSRSRSRSISTTRSNRSRASSACSNYRDDISYKCSEGNCIETFANLKDLMKHSLSIHNKMALFKCKECNIMFTKTEYLDCHIKTEHYHNVTSCPLCGDFFMNVPDLQLHLELHSKFSMPCKYCDKTFINYEQCKNHETYFHEEDQDMISAPGKIGILECKVYDVYKKSESSKSERSVENGILEVKIVSAVSLADAASSSDSFDIVLEAPPKKTSEVAVDGK